jgi:hypothetical protein
MRGAQFDAIVVQSRANGGKAVPNFRRRSDRGVLDDSVHCCGRAFGSMSAFGGIRSCRRRMNLRNTLFGSQSKSARRSSALWAESEYDLNHFRVGILCAMFSLSRSPST